MDGYDSAQIADLGGLYILDTLSRIVDPIQLGLYPDDGISYIPKSDGPKCSSILKTIIRVFKFLGFKTGNIKVANFLDVTLNLSDNSLDRSLKQTNILPILMSILITQIL